MAKYIGTISYCKATIFNKPSIYFSETKILSIVKFMSVQLHKNI